MRAPADLSPAPIAPEELDALRTGALAQDANPPAAADIRVLLRHIAWQESTLYAATPPTDEVRECILACALRELTRRFGALRDPYDQTEEAGEEYSAYAASLVSILRHYGVFVCSEVGAARLRLVTRDGSTVEPPGTYEFRRGLYRDAPPDGVA